MTKIASPRVNQAQAGGPGKLSRLRTALVLAVLVAAGVWWFSQRPTEATNLSATVAEQATKPQYGGQVNIGNVALALSALSWDSADFNWKHNLDTGLVYEQLFAADLTKATRNGGKHPFVADAYLPPETIRGELAESWQWKDDPARVEIQLRKGVMFPEKPGVMPARELTAEDIVFSYTRLDKSPKKIQGYFDHVEKVEATGPHTVVFTFKNYNAEWDYRFGWGYYSGIVPKEVADKGAGDWKNINGTGPFMLKDYVQGSQYTYEKNPNYWDSEKIDGESYKLPFVDKLVYRSIRDEATWLTALRTGKLDILEAIRWSAVPELQKSAPQLKWSKYLAMTTPYLSMRVDTKPFDDVRVRRALNMAINKQEILSSYYGGQGVMLGFPMHPTYTGFYEPLEQMPDSVKELFTYNPEKAKQLLAEAGYPNGFTFKVQTANISQENDLLSLLSAYLEKVGVKLEIQTLEYGAFLSAMMTRTVAPGYFMAQGPANPTTSLRKQFVKGQGWNPSQYNDPEFEKQVTQIFLERDESKRMALIKTATREILDKAPYIWLPVQYVYTAWWPWVQNYGGELRAGANRPGPIHTRVWIDRELKKKMGF
jgi:peptide/nickel transport system substrate-binding protein